MSQHYMLRCILALFLTGLSSSAYAAINMKTGYAVEDTPAMDRLTFGVEPTVSMNRTIVDIPQDYGKIVGTHVDPLGTLFWFEAGDGKVRNIYVEGTNRPVLIRRSGKLE